MNTLGSKTAPNLYRIEVEPYQHEGETCTCVEVRARTRWTAMASLPADPTHAPPKETPPWATVAT